MTGGITYYDTLSENFEVGQQNASAEIVILIPWADRIAFTYAYVGGVVTTFGLEAFQTPAIHPDISIYCNNVHCEPFGDYDPVNLTWESCRATIKYGPVAWATNPQHLDISIVTGLEQTPIDPSNIVTQDGAALPSDAKAFPRIHVTSELRIKYSFYTSVNSAVWKPYIGQVNSQPFPTGVTGMTPWDAGRVLFVGVETDRTVAAQAGGDQYSYAFRFYLNEDPDPNAGWNSWLDDTTGIWTPIQFKTNGNPIYATTDLNPMLPTQ